MRSKRWFIPGNPHKIEKLFSTQRAKVASVSIIGMSLDGGQAPAFLYSCQWGMLNPLLLTLHPARVAAISPPYPCLTSHGRKSELGRWKKIERMMAEFFTLTDMTVTLSYAVIAISYLMTNIFWLRVAAVIGLFIEIAYFRLTGGDLKVGIGWDLLFIAINLYQLFWLVRDRASLRLPAKEAPLLREALSGLDDSQIARLLRAADWKDAAPGETLTKQDAAVDALYFLCSGRASVEVNGSFVTYLEKGSFVGEVAYLTNDLATATVVVDEPSRILTFSKKRMAKVTAADNQISGIIYQLLGRDLAMKMRRSNTRRTLSTEESVRI